jgi:hypothetical protein
MKEEVVINELYYKAKHSHKAFVQFARKNFIVKDETTKQDIKFLEGRKQDLIKEVEVLERKVEEDKINLPQTLKQQVCDMFSISVDDFDKHQSGTKDARHVYCNVMNAYTNMTFENIGKIIERGFSTVSYSLKLYVQDNYIKKKVDDFHKKHPYKIVRFNYYLLKSKQKNKNSL